MIKSTSMKHIYICKYIHTLEAIEPTRIENRYQREDEAKTKKRRRRRRKRRRSSKQMNGLG